MAQRLVGHPDLQTIPEEKRIESIVSLFVLAGCDFVTHISGFNKATFLALFLLHATDFVCSSPTQSLADWDVLWIAREGLEEGVEPGRFHVAVPTELGPAFGAFLRMIGVSYYTRHKSRVQEQTAERSFAAVGDLRRENLEALEKWLDMLRNVTWAASVGEEGVIPSFNWGFVSPFFMRSVCPESLGFSVQGVGDNPKH